MPATTYRPHADAGAENPQLDMTGGPDGPMTEATVLQQRITKLAVKRLLMLVSIKSENGAAPSRGLIPTSSFQSVESTLAVQEGEHQDSCAFLPVTGRRATAKKTKHTKRKRWGRIFSFIIAFYSFLG